MNQLETAIPFMKTLHKVLSEKIEKLNSELSQLEIRGVDLETPLLRIKEQIASAETKYTIAFIGTFKTGKSTIINSLLELKGSDRLSNEFDPDTAKCIRIIRKPKGQKYDAEVLFMENAYPTEQLSWVDAKKYTSHIALENGDLQLMEKSKKVEEVRYYIDNPILDVCNILDLPGTGTGTYSEDTDVTDRKIMEADCVFWVVSTDMEPDTLSIENLKKIKTKMLPIINVWQYENENIYSLMSSDEIKEILQTQCEAYLASAEDPLCYYAREIDEAQREGRELKEEWGKEAFSEKVQEMLSNIQAGDRMRRIKNQLQTALGACETQLKAVQEDTDLIGLKGADEKEKADINKHKAKLGNARRLASSEVRSHAKATSQEILSIFSDASDSFIDMQMQGTNLMALFGKRRVEEKLKCDFEDNYVRLKSGWLDKVIQQYTDEVNEILKGIYIDFALDIESTPDHPTKFAMEKSALSGFVDDMAGLIQKDIVTKITPTIVAAIGAGILLCIPGGAVVESLAGVVLGGLNAAIRLPNDDKLRQKNTMVKNAAKVQIRQQKAEMVMTLTNEGMKLDTTYVQRIEAALNVRASENQKKLSQLTQLDSSIKDMIDFIRTQREELNTL